MPAPDGARLAVADARVPRVCVTCGLTLEPPWWVTTFPLGEHERCRDWTGRPFPFARHEELLRKIARHLDGEQRRAILGFTGALSRLARTWPRDALATLDAARIHVATARTCCEGAPHKLIAQL